MGVTMMTLLVVLFSLFIACANCNIEEKVLECMGVLESEYITPTPNLNIWHSFTNLKLDMFKGENTVLDEVEGYYIHLIYMLDNYVLLTVISPNEYCNTTTRGNLYRTGRPASEWCLAAFNKMGCSISMQEDGFECFKHIYFNHLLNDITVETIFPDWIETIPSMYRQDERYVRQRKMNFEWQIEMIKGYINGPLQTKIKNLSNYYYFSWENFCRDRLRTM